MTAVPSNLEKIRVLVRGVGLEPTRFIQPTDFKSVAYTNSATRALGGTDEIRTRVNGFADRCLTPRPPRHSVLHYSNKKASHTRLSAPNNYTSVLAMFATLVYCMYTSCKRIYIILQFCCNKQYT